MEEDNNRADGRDELLANVRRLTCILLDRLDQGSREGTLDQGQMRMLGSIALRALRLWQEALGKIDHGQPVNPRLLEGHADLARKLADSEKLGGER